MTTSTVELRELLERITRKFSARPHWDSMNQGQAIAELRALLSEQPQAGAGQEAVAFTSRDTLEKLSARGWIDARVSKCADEMRDVALYAATPTQASAWVPEGWKLVPVEPTRAMMLNESGCQHHAWDDNGCAARRVRFGVWAKMLAAAPTPGAKPCATSMPRE